MPRTGWCATLKAFLSDGEWHTLGELMARIGPMIRPEVAARAGAAQGVSPISLDCAIWRGRKRLMLADLVRQRATWDHPPPYPLDTKVKQREAAIDPASQEET